MKPCKYSNELSNGINYQPQLVNAGFLPVHSSGGDFKTHVFKSQDWETSCGDSRRLRSGFDRAKHTIQYHAMGYLPIHEFR